MTAQRSSVPTAEEGSTTEEEEEEEGMEEDIMDAGWREEVEEM